MTNSLSDNWSNQTSPPPPTLTWDLGQGSRSRVMLTSGCSLSRNVVLLLFVAIYTSWWCIVQNKNSDVVICQSITRSQQHKSLRCVTVVLPILKIFFHLKKEGRILLQWEAHFWAICFFSFCQTVQIQIGGVEKVWEVKAEY